MRMRQGNGFTLIELVVVIVILGILSAVAAPKFMDLQRDARISAVQGLVGAIKSSVSMVYDKSIIVGREKQASSCIWAHTSGADDDTCDPTSVIAQNNDDAIFTIYGWPEATIRGLPRTLSEIPEKYVDATTTYTGDWVYREIAGSAGNPGQLYIWPVKAVPVDVTNDGDVGCGVIYTEATDDSRPELKIVRTDC